MVKRLPRQLVQLLRVLSRGVRGGRDWQRLKHACASLSSVPLLEMAMGAWVSQVIYVAAKLGIADVLSDGPKSCEEIAAVTRTPAPALSRLLRALRSLGVIGTVDGGKFELTGLGGALQAKRPGSLRGLVLTLGETHYEAWGALLHSVKTGAPAFPSVFGARLFEYLDQDRGAGDTFQEAMNDVSALVSQAVILAYQFSGIHLLADVGGGCGQFLMAVLDAVPDMCGILLETPAVIAAATEKLASHPCRQRCALVPGNFLEAVPQGASAYLMSGVIHDWNDEQTIRILDNCRRAMAPNGKVLVVEMVLPSKDEPRFAALLDLNMLVMNGGRERTEEDFRQLFAAAGLQVTRLIPTLAPQWVIEGTRREAVRRCR
jgi:ubiquinone/menaquinone biosynthesis C-methylase UbiE